MTTTIKPTFTLESETLAGPHAPAGASSAPLEAEDFAREKAQAKVEEEFSALTAPIPDRLYFRIGDVADLLGVKPYVLRYWETEFPIISPQKSTTGQRVYRKSDVETLVLIKHLLYKEKYSIEGARRRIRELRKDGELKNSKKEVSSHASSVNPEILKEIKQAAQDLKTLIQMPLAKIFYY
jgi:DNA-binding transcriptional MerR regulator